MANGKRVEGVELCDACTAYGLPPTLTYDQWVQLTLNVERSQMQRVYEATLAHGIASGQPGPLAYYQLMTDGDPRRAALMIGEQRLAAMMGG